MTTYETTFPTATERREAEAVELTGKTLTELCRRPLSKNRKRDLALLMQQRPYRFNPTVLQSYGIYPSLCHSIKQSIIV